ncbi:replication fork protection component Swi3-domain-containing protein [Diplogelasinospora grovesii]|uniref:Chromosome segregation in meiosis protein n=1 Tax=Diplogelasinospora grovesii TaxID=303347 RepID=A0AAN6N2H9_9PEZI|nr:replication fork protection component Swi3-domain-containing protein [Diplogelasinospora grovesii]
MDTNSFMDDYLAGWDDDDPFRSPSPDGAEKRDKDKDKNKKRKEAGDLGIDEQIEVQKKARAPRVKLDETLLLSEKGIPTLRKTARKLRFKGKGHEFSDAARLLSFYQQWLDALFPKATFLDGLAMIEKAGHKTIMHKMRMEWINEGKPKSTLLEDDNDEYSIARDQQQQPQPRRIAPIFDSAAATATAFRDKTAALEDVLGDEDIYNASPRRATRTAAAGPPTGDVPDEDDLDALMAEADAGPDARHTNTMPSFTSIFGDGPSKKPPENKSTFGNGARRVTEEPDEEEDLDALMAEADAETRMQLTKTGSSNSTSLFGDGRPSNRKLEVAAEEDEDDLDALMAEAEAQSAPPPQKRDAGQSPRPGGMHENANDKSKEPHREDVPRDDEDDDLDALMAEVEA